ncbi:hypothetical protein [Aestuariispira insulae]|uniref:Uncharacterized protein n=1 Tax=Aestuariispira insulae TaxID=1461337 RepID=A0A3D9HVL6_9PROT|nr:hypothetical protein [Aestuariispira insulae]RED53469.1 hypothetical protein DFP90_101258 [Aestuariispira insulae]
MKYDVSLIDAQIEHAMKGKMRLGICMDGREAAQVSYDWNDEHFTARFIGHAPSMPVPAHPIAFVAKPLEAIQAMKTERHKLPTDVFYDHQVSFNLAE